VKTSPRPWKWVEGTGSDQGELQDADGNRVCWFGDDEQYYPTAGEPPYGEDIELILSAVNAVPNEHD